jgi:uncharacterized protein (DUF433 family)
MGAVRLMVDMNHSRNGGGERASLMAREIYPGVTVDPEVVHGKPVVSGTRIPVALVLGQLAAGVSYEELEREYGLSQEQAQAAIGYAAQLVASESVYAVTTESVPGE